MKPYLDVLRSVLLDGVLTPNRTGYAAVKHFGHQSRYWLTDGQLPAVTTKKMFFRGIILELLWIIGGETNNTWLTDQNVHIWDEWALEEAERGGVDYDLLIQKWAEKHNTENEQETIRAVMEFLNEPENDQAALLEHLGLSQEKDGAVITAAGELGPIYGAMWRTWLASDGKRIDQLQDVIGELKRDPNSRRLVVSAWNPEVLPLNGVSPQDNVKRGRQALAPCHAMFQFVTRPMNYLDRLAWLRNNVSTISEDNYDAIELHVSNMYLKDKDVIEGLVAELMDMLDSVKVPKYFLSCQLYQRSADVFLGVPFNITSYALLTHMVAKICNMAPYEFIHTLGDYHIYENHLEQVQIQLEREPFDPPTVKLTGDQFDITDFKLEDIVIEGYQSHGKLKGDVAV